MEILEAIKTAEKSGKITAETAKNLSEWINANFLPEWATGTIAELFKNENWEEINDRFFKKIAFGTGGMRGRTIGKITPAQEAGTRSELGAPEHPAVGTAYLNDFNNVRASVGRYRFISNFLGNGKTPKFVIGNDFRHFSEHFCKLAASVWTKLGGEAYIFEGPRSTPQLSFTIRELKTDTGIVITASHNPSHDNGFKCYFNDGAQVIAPHAEAIIEEVNSVALSEIPQLLKIDLSAVKIVPAAAEKKYLADLECAILDPETLKKNSVKVCFTNIHGTGDVMIVPALKKFGVDFEIVEEQKTHDGRFPTVKSPNPENAEAFTLALKKAKEIGAEIVLGTDPDDDRVGMAARGNDGNFVLYSGNQTGTMLTAFRIERMKELGILPAVGTPNAAIIKTFVTSPLQDAIAEKNGIRCVNALTGFKWIGAKLQKYQKIVEKTFPNYMALSWKERAEKQISAGTFFVVGGEESYGYLHSDSVRDKDGNAAVLMLVEMAAWLKSKKMSVPEYLDSIYKKYGYFSESLLNIVLEGAKGAAQIKQILNSLRKNPPKEILGNAVVSFLDFGRDEIKDSDGDVIPKEDFYFFTLGNGMKVAVRGSGTEPKIKFYIFATSSESDLAKAKLDAAKSIEEVKAFLNKDALIRSEI